VLAKNEIGLSVTVLDMEVEAERYPSDVTKSTYANAEHVRRIALNLITRRALAADFAQTEIDTNPKLRTALRLARERVLAEARVQQFDGDAPQPGALEKLAYAEYNATLPKYRVEEAVRLSHLQIGSYRVGGRQLAEELLEKLRSGKANFATLAYMYSDDATTKAKHGDMGFFENGRLRPELDRAAFALAKPGEISDIIETDQGWHLLRLDEKRPAGFTSFETVKTDLVKSAAKRIVDQRRASGIEPFEHGVEFDAEAVAAFTAGFR